MARTKAYVNPYDINRTVSKNIETGLPCIYVPEWVYKQPCQNYCCSAFALFEDEKLTKPADLNNQIHQIFRRENFSEDFDYDLIEASLRLASLLLQSDVLVPYINTVFDGQYQEEQRVGADVVSLEPLDWTPGTLQQVVAVYPKPGQDEINDTTRARAKAILKQMAEMVEFHITAWDNPDAGGNCESDEQPLPRHSAEMFPQGCRSRINIGRSQIYDLLQTAAKEPNLLSTHEPARQLALEELLVRRFKLVDGLVHEMAHAFEIAAHGHRFNEMLYKDSPLEEAGFEMTALLFGGDIAYLRGHCYSHPLRGRDICPEARLRDPRAMLFLTEWPSSSIAQQYAWMGCNIGPFGQFREFDIAWRCPLTYLEALFTNEFWRQADSQGLTATQAPRIASWPFWVDEKGQQTPILLELCVQEASFPEAVFGDVDEIPDTIDREWFENPQLTKKELLDEQKTKAKKGNWALTKLRHVCRFFAMSRSRH